MQIAIRGIDEEFWREFRSVVVKKGKTTGEAITEAIKLWMKQK